MVRSAATPRVSNHQAIVACPSVRPGKPVPALR
jgi:hypothetical protein